MKNQSVEDGEQPEPEPKLRALSEQIRNLLKDNNFAGIVILHSGTQMATVSQTFPSWLCVGLEEEPSDIGKAVAAIIKPSVSLEDAEKTTRIFFEFDRALQDSINFIGMLTGLVASIPGFMQRLADRARREREEAREKIRRN